MTHTQHYLALMRWDKPAGAWLVLWPAWWAAILASEPLPNPLLLTYLALGAIIMRSAGCIINDLTDRDLDKQVARTANRPLASNAVSLSEAYALLALLLSLGALICWLIKPTLFLLAIPVLGLIIAYPWMKRITWWPQVFLGVTFNMGVWFGWFAVEDSFSFVPVFLYIAAIFWTIGFDTIYAHQDIKDDLMIGIKSTAIRLGRHNRLFIAACYCFTSIFWLFAGINISANTGFYIGWFFACSLLGWQLWKFEEKEEEIARQLFKLNQWCGLIMVLACLNAEYGT